MSKKEFSQTRTVVSPDGKTVTTITVSGSSEAAENTSTVTTSFMRIQDAIAQPLRICASANKRLQ